MAKTISYGIRCNSKWLQRIEANERYTKGTAPTMGTRHTPCEYKTVWGTEEVFFEPYTLASNIKILLEEFRWETKKPVKFVIVPEEGEV